MKLFGFNITKEKIESENFQAFSSPFQKVGDGNLSLPTVKSYVKNQYVPFGDSNLYPQLLNQLYFTSPLHSAIVDFKVNAVLGGGYELKKQHLDAKGLVDVIAFERRVKLPQFVKQLLQELIIHNRLYLIGTKTKDGAKFKNHVCPSKVRVNKDKTVYYISNDWSVHEKIAQIKKYKDAKVGEDFIWCYENNSLGQDVYPLPVYTSANNYILLDGEISYLHKSNILNSIFPSFIINFPRKPQSEEEQEQIRKTIEGLKGAGNAGKSAAFFGAGKENMPEIVSMPTNNNDSLFYQTGEAIDSKICQAHTIDPILMGIRVSGKLGSGSDIKQSYVIFEKNVIMPLRDEIEIIINSIFDVFGVNTKMSINDYQIVNETIIETEDNKGSQTSDALNAMSPLVATKVLESMTQNEIRSLAGLKGVEGGEMRRGEQTPSQGAPKTETPQEETLVNDALRGLSAQENMDMIRVIRDFNKGKLSEPIAKARLASYGFDAETIKQILEI